MITKRIYGLLSLLLAISMLLASCAPKPTPTPSLAPVQTEAPTQPAAPKPIKIGFFSWRTGSLLLHHAARRAGSRRPLWR
jgi:hypothetical protein